jgi:translation initiation factor IF-2
MARRLDDTGPTARGPPPGRRTAQPPSRGEGGRVRGRAAGPRPVRRAQADHLGGRGGGVAVRAAVGDPAPAGPALPDLVPGRHPGHDPARLPAPGPGPGRPQGGAGGRRRQPGAARLGPGRRGSRLAPLPAAGVRRLRPPGGPPHRPGRGPRRGRGAAGAGGDPPHRRLGPARHLPRLRRLRVPWRCVPLRLGAGPQGLRPGTAGRPDLHGDRGAVRRPLGRGRHLHRAVHHLRAVLEYSGAGRFFIDVSFAAFGTRSAAAPAAPPPWPGSCSGPCPGRGWRPR